MDCVDRNIEPDDIDERISRFVLEEMASSEESDFKQHLVECDLCRKRTLAFYKITNLARIRGCYDRLCKAYDQKDWEEVIRLGDEMEALGYDEYVHPIKDKLQNSKSNLDLQYTKFDELEKAYQNEEWEKVVNIAIEMKDLNYDEEEHPIKKKYNKALRYYIYFTNKQIEKAMDLLIREVGLLKYNRKLSQSEIDKTINNVMGAVKSINKDMPFPEIMSAITEGLKLIYKAETSTKTEAGVKLIDDFTQFQTILSKIGAERVEEILSTSKEESYSKSISKYDEWELKDD